MLKCTHKIIILICHKVLLKFFGEDDIESKEHNGKAYLNGVIVNFDFVSGQYDNQQSAPAPQQQQAPQAAPQQQSPEFEDDIPW